MRVSPSSAQTEGLGASETAMARETSQVRGRVIIVASVDRLSCRANNDPPPIEDAQGKDACQERKREAGLGVFRYRVQAALGPSSALAFIVAAARPQIRPISRK